MEFLEQLTSNNRALLLFYVAPGFISLKIWHFIYPSQKISLSDSLIEVIIYSSFNALVLTGLNGLLSKYLNSLLVYGICFLLFPVIWPLLFHGLFKIKPLRKQITPTSWDYFFNQGNPCFILFHMKNGKLLGGLYGSKSFTSSYPKRKDIYLEEVWKLDVNGKFLEKMANTAGLLVHFDEVDHLEFFALEGDIRTEGEHNAGTEV